MLLGTLLLRNVRASQTLLEVANRLQALSFTLVADFPWLLLAVLSVAILLGLLRTSFHLQFTNLLWLKMAILFLDGERKNVRKLLTVSMDVSLANFNLDLKLESCIINVVYSYTGA